MAAAGTLSIGFTLTISGMATATRFGNFSQGRIESEARAQP